MRAVIGRWDDQQVTPATGEPQKDELYVPTAARAKSISGFNKETLNSLKQLRTYFWPSLGLSAAGC